MRRRLLCASASRITAASLLLSFLAVTTAAETPMPQPALLLPPPPPQPLPHAPHNNPTQQPAESQSGEKDFSLRHVFHHGTYKYPQLHRRLDVPENAAVWMADDKHSAHRAPVPRLRTRAEVVSIQRLADRSRETVDGMLEFARLKGRPVQLAHDDWTIDDLAGPNVTDKETVLSFARMASNAYILEPNTGEWEDVGGGFNYTQDFGWESDGLRGHIFADTQNSTVVIGLKGTSPAMFDGSETTTNDKINDNLFFSCCCGQGGQYLWRQVCDCQTSAYTCNSTCLVTALREKNRYYYAAQDLYHNVTALYPTADIWLAGHSLGGAVASFLSLTFGHPAVTFEAVPDAMPASRLGLPVPPGHQVGSLQQRRLLTGGYHFGHTADPIYMGTCNQATSVCTFGGYAMQSVCHTGLKCVYDTVKDFGWRVGIGTHKIVEVIRDVLEKYDEPAKCVPYLNCTDCYTWQYFESNGTETTTTSKRQTATKSKITTRTRTETCKTPGWWGCLDESTTASHRTKTSTRSTATSTTSTSTCKTPGWFGCKDDDDHKSTAFSTVPSVTTTSMFPTATSSCKYPGWFGGCLDGEDPPSTTQPRSSMPTPTASSTTCTSEGWFGLICYDKSKHKEISQPTATSTSTTSCTSEGFFGLICFDETKSHLRTSSALTITERMEM